MSDASPRAPGRRLREARERRNLPVSRVVEQLRLEPPLLAALEADRWQELGAPVYARGYIRRYATLVGLPAEELVADYDALDNGVAPPSLVPQASARNLSTARRRNPLPFFVAGVLVLALAGLYLWFTRMPPADAPAPEPAQATTAAGAAAPAEDAAQPQVPAAAMQPLPAVADRRPSDPPPVSPASAANPAAAPAAPAVSERPAAAAAPVTLEARFRGQSWFEAYDAAGRRATFELAPAGARRSLQLTPPLRVLLGNASVVTLAVNGRPARVPPGLIVADTAWVQIDADGAVSAAAPRRVDSGSE